ncbi:SpoIIE family protein phosphatase [Streptomonospora sp. PA3]|uniref:PP2C family protein-serine/threonine phosphatase n=1 Tax=Streptomonospora sp. PA3 TaxID=2607326 RepID=UPI0012DE1BBA|nr:GAF domain-containing SpoIIE family protein phosphatase [Streptomonospora sp. PA3]MUL41146.1 SpoIIE family protein phosphatase [Streptomonospora sp. PA3]
MSDDARRAAESDRDEDVERSLSGLRLLAEAGTVLGSSLDPEDVLHRLARLMVPALADWCVANYVSEHVRRVAVVHRDPNVEAPTSLLGTLPDPDPLASTPLERMLAGEGPLVFTETSEATSALGRAHRELTEALGTCTEILVPLRARRRVLGGLVLVRTTRDRPVTDDELVLLEDLAHRAGLALDNARLYSAQRDAAQNFQRALLPDLPFLEHVQLAARYAPAQEGVEVGGDWYDAFILPDGAVTLTVGDVSGHDLSAAVQMSKLQSMLRTLAWEHQEPPSAIMRRLDGLLEYFSAHTATAVYGRLERDSAGGPLVFHWANAGHFPPLLITAEGTTRFLPHGEDVLLGVGVDWERDDARAKLPSGATLLLYTDGLVERRGEDVDRGMVRLRQQAALFAGEPPADLCDGLLSQMSDSSEDDVVLLAVRAP